MIMRPRQPAAHQLLVNSLRISATLLPHKQVQYSVNIISRRASRHGTEIGVMTFHHGLYRGFSAQVDAGLLAREVISVASWAENPVSKQTGFWAAFGEPK